jgi:hypothetical protein
MTLDAAGYTVVAASSARDIALHSIKMHFNAVSHVPSEHVVACIFIAFRAF